VALISGYMQDSYRYALDGWVFLPEEGILLVACIVLGKLAALLPAIQAYRTDIANTLTQRG
jgi:putative ABC transport system permease protein